MNAHGSQNGAQWTPNGTQWTPNGGQLDPNGLQMDPNGFQNAAEYFKIDAGRDFGTPMDFNTLPNT